MPQARELGFRVSDHGLGTRVYKFRFSGLAASLLVLSIFPGRGSGR